MLTAPAEPDHAQVVVRHLPATEAARVGGDWYDAFLQLGGATNLGIGDVVGHDTAAAAFMGRRRGIAVTVDAGPAQLLTELDTAFTQLQVHTYATAADRSPAMNRPMPIPHAASRACAGPTPGIRHRWSSTPTSPSSASTGAPPFCSTPTASSNAATAISTTA
ncbi:SpoIIE family protein phosphatase [Blastococcus saxobsidens]|uniref:PPM-type phosphatase domain-containing protein n=1 Tax=Blastococcus saxobsidens (strain DD2) TaxID=1146883 RepID=H6RP50_BLASD|nr:protein of unknown function [Blastococcus saxobsidens DD2]